MQDGDENLAATAKPARAVVSAGTAAQLGVGVDQVTVTGPAGSVTVPLVVEDVADSVVWLPTNARGCAVRSTLGARNGTVVTVSGGRA